MRRSEIRRLLDRDRASGRCGDCGAPGPALCDRCRAILEVEADDEEYWFEPIETHEAFDDLPF